jgi:hypothetical protein
MVIATVPLLVGPSWYLKLGNRSVISSTLDLLMVSKGLVALLRHWLI